ncbi:hypothetical protein [Kribbella sp. CA-247076]|uniref:hypothetical protein n=1 Tax=Kribbella sp. CA-247076 TaxID=3239941 RepID=UPI003D8FA80B
MHYLRSQDGGRDALEHCVLSLCRTHACPGSSAVTNHPPTVCLREDQLSSKLNDWIATLFSPGHVDATVDALAIAANESSPEKRAEAEFGQRIAAAEGAMVRLRRALDAGWDPTELTSQYNAAAAEKRVAEAGVASIEARNG